MRENGLSRWESSARHLGTWLKQFIYSNLKILNAVNSFKKLLKRSLLIPLELPEQVSKYVGNTEKH